MCLRHHRAGGEFLQAMWELEHFLDSELALQRLFVQKRHPRGRVPVLSQAVEMA
jgi:hypothetical protein